MFKEGRVRVKIVIHENTVSPQTGVMDASVQRHDFETSRVIYKRGLGTYLCF